MKIIYTILASVLLIILMTSMIAAVSYQVGLPDVYRDKKDIQYSYDEKLSVYKVTMNCDNVILNQRIWDKREIISMETYMNPRYPQKEYCGIIYHRI